VEKTGEVCLDDDKFGQMGFQQRPNHQIGAVEWPQSVFSSIGGGDRLRLATNWRPFWKCRLKPDSSAFAGIAWTKRPAKLLKELERFEGAVIETSLSIGNKTELRTVLQTACCAA